MTERSLDADGDDNFESFSANLFVAESVLFEDEEEEVATGLNEAMS